MSKKQNNSLSKDIFQSEFNFLKYPFFNISSRTTTEKNEIKFTEKIYEKNIEISISWHVFPSALNDLPGTFARRIHKEIVEKRLNNLQKPIPRLIYLGSLSQICKELGLKSRETNRVKKALKDIKLTNISAKNTFKVKDINGAKKYIDATFNLYDGVFFTGDILPDGIESGAVYILLSDYYVQNFNNNFVVPLDYQYMQSLRGDIASRMYEYFSIWFYPVFTNGKKYVERKYSTLCNYFPLTRQDSKWKAKKQLHLAHRQHVINGFLQCNPKWKDIGKKDDWLIQYNIGPKAQEWFYNIKQGKMPTTITVQKQIDKSIDPLLSKLIALKIPQNRAQELVKNYNNDNLIEEWIDALEALKPQNKAGFLVTALKEKWELPEQIRKKKLNKTKRQEEKLKGQYYESIFKQVDKWAEENIEKEQFKKEIERHKKIFLKKYPDYKQFENSIFLNPFIENDYKKMKAEELGLITFEKWIEQKIQE